MFKRVTVALGMVAGLLLCSTATYASDEPALSAKVKTSVEVGQSHDITTLVNLLIALGFDVEIVDLSVKR